MVGPPPDPRQVLVPADDPWGWALSLGLALCLLAFAAWRRPGVALRVWAAILGQVVLMTAPLASMLQRVVYGSFPTVDKEGSLLFYLDGVHRRILLHPLDSLSDPAARLIGVHIGHLWVTQLFDLFLTPLGAFNLQALLSPALAWFCAWLLIRELTGDGRAALLAGFGFGMGLHVFRDLNWYTIEKAAIFWLPLWSWLMIRAARRGGRWIVWAGLGFGLMSWMNLYLGMVAGLMGGLGAVWLGLDAWRGRQLGALHWRGLGALLTSALFASPLVAWQLTLLRHGPQLGTPDDFLWQRAALDGFSLVPLRWNRLELPRALHPVVLAAAIYGAWRPDRRVRALLVGALALWVLSIGPLLLPGVSNPVYMAARAVLPGFWRVAKPEVFFHASWLALCVIAGIGLSRIRPSRVTLLYVLTLLSWFWLVRAHPAFPPLTRPVQTTLSPDWADRVFPGG